MPQDNRIARTVRFDSDTLVEIEAEAKKHNRSTQQQIELMLNLALKTDCETCQKVQANSAKDGQIIQDLSALIGRLGSRVKTFVAIA